MLQPKIAWSLVLFALAVSANGQNLQNCSCSLFLKDPLWRPNIIAAIFRVPLEVTCENPSKAQETCQKMCSEESEALKKIFKMDPGAKITNPPSSRIPCGLLPQDTFSFFKVCGDQIFKLASRSPGPRVCCNSTSRRSEWCETTELPTNNEVSDGRKIDLKKDKNDESLNEIDSEISTMLNKFDKPVPVKPVKPNPSIVKSVMNFMGYENFGDVLKGIDVFSLPSKLQSASKDYKDEMSMGRCYMEFTTFKVFAKQDTPFARSLRKKRSSAHDVPDISDLIEQDAVQYDAESRSNMENMLENVAQGLTTILDQSREGRQMQYASMINSVLPFITQMAGGSSSNEAQSPLSMILKFAGPIISQMTNSGSQGPSNTNSGGPGYPQNDAPQRPAGSSPLTAMAMNMISNVVSNFLQRPQAPLNRVETVPTTTPPTTTTTTTTTPYTTRAPSTFPQMKPVPAQPSIAGQAISNLMKLFMNSRPNTVYAEDPNQHISSDESTSSFQNKQQKNFADVLLEFIRPVFISIFGNAPGDSGVKEIRRASTFDTLGRVDDTLVEEVNSPLFCFKKYVVNKAWSVTESGVRSLVSNLSPEEQQRMMRKL